MQPRNYQKDENALHVFGPAHLNTEELLVMLTISGRERENGEVERTKERVLSTYDGPRRLWKDEMMLDNEFEVRIRLPSGERSNMTKEKMERERSNMTIEESARICRQSFNECLTYFDMLSPKQQSAIEDQLGRFSIWAFSIGVFASYRASLDYRLRGVDEIQRLIRRLLQTLDEHIQQYLSYVRPLVIDSTANEPRQNGIAQAINDDLDSAICDISEEIGLLHQLSNTIRKASRETHSLKAATSFVIRDEEGNDYGSAFRELFAFALIHWRFQECDETIKQRLAAAMLLRRKRILYRRSRYGVFQSSNATSSVPKRDVPNIEQAQNSTQDAQNDNIENSIPEHGQEQGDVKSQTNTATTLHMEQWKRASTPSVISRPNTIRLSDQERLEFPPPPKGPILQKLKERREYWISKHDEELSSLDNYLTHKQHIDNLSETDYDTWRQNHISDLHDELEERIENDRDACYKGNMEVICPYCCSMLSSAIVMNDHRWIDHVKHDLDPYVCLFKTCDTPDILYNHSQDWLKHMRQHKLRQWRCAAKSHGVLLFKDQMEYEEHMRTKHKNTESQLSMLVERGSRSSGPIFDSCPLCETSDFDTSVEDHIAVHLRYLALKSLPFTDDGEDDEGSDGAAIISEELDRESQGTIAADPDYGTPLNFEDTDSTPMSYDEPESLHNPEEHSQDVPLSTDSDGTRKRNARFEIPKERTLSNIDQLIAQSTNDEDIKELKQQKRLLRNRQAAFDSRQRKKPHTETLEEETGQFTNVIDDPEKALQAEAGLSGAGELLRHRDKSQGLDDTDDSLPQDKRHLAGRTYSEAVAAELLQHRKKSQGLDYAQEAMAGLFSDRVVEDFLNDESSGSPQPEESSSALSQYVLASSATYSGRIIEERVPQDLHSFSDSDEDSYRPGDWKCGSEGCGYHNFARNTYCLRCGAPVRGGAVVTDSAFPSPTDPPSGFQIGASSISDRVIEETEHAPGPIFDAEDGVMRCPNCSWELEEHYCPGCGYHVEDGTISSMRDPDDFPRAGVSSSRPARNVPASSTTRIGEMVASGISTSEIGAVDAPPPHQPRVLPPPPPDWLVSGLEELKRDFPDGRFSALMLYSAVDTSTMMRVVATNTDYTTPNLKYQFLPRIQCLDCPEELHVPGPGMSVRHFKMHLLQSQHTQRVEERIKDAAKLKREVKAEKAKEVRANREAEKDEAIARLEKIILEERAERLKRENAPESSTLSAEKNPDQSKIDIKAAKEPIADRRTTEDMMVDATKDEAIARLEKLILEERAERQKRDQKKGDPLKYRLIPADDDSDWTNIELKAAKKRPTEDNKTTERMKTEAKLAAQRAAISDPNSLLKEFINFKDAVGRKFTFPWDMCNTWKGMEDLIRQAFLHVEVIGPHVAEGHYDLVGPNGDIILPQVWESVIEPGWSVTMHMWPIPEKPKEPPTTQSTKNGAGGVNSDLVTGKKPEREAKLKSGGFARWMMGGSKPRKKP